MKYIFEFAEYSADQVLETALGILGDTGDKSQFGEQTDYFKQLVLEARNLGIDAYVFTDFDADGTTAWTLEADNTWSKSRRGLPKVFYDRSFRKKAGAKNRSNTQALSGLGCTPINSPDFRKVALDKHLMYSSLVPAQLGELGLPYTERYSKKGLLPFLQERPVCIIKPRFGSGGKGIIKVTKEGTRYELSYQGNSIQCSEANLVNTISEVRKKMRTSNRLHIIQECISLPKYNDSVFDVRVIYQRGANGSALRTGMAVRLAAPKNIAANLHQGGSRETLSRVLGALFNQDSNGPIAESIRAHSKFVFENLDSKFGPIGEIGIDFLIDQSGKVHLIEVNSIPGRSLFHIIPDIRQTSIKRPVEYAKYLLNKKSR
jgi:glutathione synthase/RimK-type ligase-like ATP-grasp enzyme